MARREVTYQLVDPVTTRAVYNARGYVYLPGTLTPVQLWEVPEGGSPVEPPQFTGADGFVRCWVDAAQLEVDLALDDNDGLAFLAPDPLDLYSFAPFTATVQTQGSGGGGQATVCKTVLVTGVGASYTTVAKARRVSVTWDNASSAEAQLPTIDGVPLAPSNGPSTIVFGTLESLEGIPPLTIATHQNNDAVTILEEC